METIWFENNCFSNTYIINRYISTHHFLPPINNIFPWILTHVTVISKGEIKMDILIGAYFVLTHTLDARAWIRGSSLVDICHSTEVIKAHALLFCCQVQYLVVIWNPDIHIYSLCTCIQFVVYKYIYIYIYIHIYIYDLSFQNMAETWFWINCSISHNWFYRWADCKDCSGILNHKTQPYNQSWSWS